MQWQQSRVQRREVHSTATRPTGVTFHSQAAAIQLTTNDSSSATERRRRRIGANAADSNGRRSTIGSACMRRLFVFSSRRRMLACACVAAETRLAGKTSLQSCRQVCQIFQAARPLCTGERAHARTGTKAARGCEEWRACVTKCCARRGSTQQSRRRWPVCVAAESGARRRKCCANFRVTFLPYLMQRRRRRRRRRRRQAGSLVGAILTPSELCSGASCKMSAR